MDSVTLGVDVGGTFTDVVLVADGALTTAKVPTTDRTTEGVVRGVRAACERAGVEPSAVDRFRHATTVSVNALLEGAGATTALVTTEGFADVLDIGRQARPELYDPSAARPAALVAPERRYEVAERATPEGIETAVDEATVRNIAAQIRGSDAESVAVAFLHAYAHPENERRAAAVLREELDCPVSVSHEVLGEFREYERTATTAADAAVTPLVGAYLDRLADRADTMGLPAPEVMQANGGTASAATARDNAVTTVLSGPAAGVVGAAAHERREGLVTLDMGGTSTDVSLVRDGEAERTTEADVGGHPVRIPRVDVATVGAGGGSLARVDAGGALRVGPESAGAEPGPVCYGKGGSRPTVTDADLVLGYLGADTELGDGLALDAAAAEAALADLAAEADLDSAREAALGVHRVANARMSRAIRAITVERGHDPRTFALAAFGGAGPMHAAALADRLDVPEVVVPRASGVLSALGLLAADETHDAARTVRTPLDEADPDSLAATYDGLAETVLADCTDPDGATVERRADLRYAGQRFELTVDVPDPLDVDTLEGRFHAAHDRTRGYRMDEPITAVTLRVTATIPGERPAPGYAPSGEARIGTREAVFPGGSHETPVFRRVGLSPGTERAGPAIVEDRESTVVVPPEWSLRVEADGALVLEGDR